MEHFIVCDPHRQADAQAHVQNTITGSLDQTHVVVHNLRIQTVRVRPTLTLTLTFAQGLDLELNSHLNRVRY